MTHDELLARIDANFQGIEVDSKHISAEIVNAWHKALRAVVELHKPDSFESEGETVTICPECNYEYFWSPDNDDDRWPCDTIKAIERKVK